ncbi:MAG: type II toxin-antitoxin system HigB family toxin, partial [Calditrichia bacterium]
MQVIKRKAMVDFIRKHADARSSLESWYYEVKQAEWKTPGDIKAKYASVSFLSNNR